MQKYGHDDARPVLERASARETAARVALGELARRFLRQALGIDIVSHVVAIGTVCVPDGTAPGPQDGERIDADPVRCLDPATSAAMVHEIDIARKDGDTLGGVVEVLAYGVPPGLGSYVHADRRLDARLAAALMSIQAIKGIEIGDGFETARRRGSHAHDEIEYGPDGLRRRTNRAGGIEGGVTNGEPVVVRVAMKPIPTLARALASVDLKSKEPFDAAKERTDSVSVPAAAVVGEAVVAFVLADAFLDKFAGDTLEDVRRAFDAYLEQLRRY
jgi:chorismate synthase